MKGEAHPSPFAALAFPNSEKVPVYYWVDREFSSRRMAKPCLELTTFRRLSAPWPSRSNHPTTAPLTGRRMLIKRYVLTVKRWQSIELYYRNEKKVSLTGNNSDQNTRGYQKVLSLTWKEPEIWIYSALFFNVVPFQLHTLVPSSFPVINTRSVEVNILVP